MIEGRACISVFDKTGVVDFAKGLQGLNYQIVSTGGTEKTLREAGVDVISVSDVTGFPECLDGRVKTLHPAVHAGILARRDNPAHMERIRELQITPIDIVAVNLYPFKETVLKPDCTLEEAIENIDIGGPSMIRAAAKNYQDVLVVTDYKDYNTVIQYIKGGGFGKATRLKFAAKAFEMTAAYDALISSYLNEKTGRALEQKLTLTFEKKQEMRYGENPHQQAAFYAAPLPVKGSLTEAEQLNGKELSYNNINDANAAIKAVREFEKPAAVGLKHANPCGVGEGETLFDAYMKAYECDPTSIFGGIVALNRTVDEETAGKLAETFLEIVVAPDYTEEALAVLKKKKNLRVLRLPAILEKQEGLFEYKSVEGGLLVQQTDDPLLCELQTVTKREPTRQELADLLFAWKVVKHVKSNGIVAAKDGATTGIGPGQVNRIWATEEALSRSGEKVRRAVLASDAFFPFSDCVEAAAKAGVTAIIQPGGSVRDQESVELADKFGMAMVVTNMRHFKH